MKRRLDSGEPATDQDASPWSQELNSLGWRGAARDSPAATSLRAHLAAHNGGISNCAELFAVRPGEVNVGRAAEIFHKYGFVVVQDALTQERLQKLRHGVETVVPEILAQDPGHKGNRGTHRYSFGQASRTGSLAHREEWVQLIDLDTVAPILQRILGPGYKCRSVGGDFVLPGCLEYQELHRDVDANERLRFAGEAGTKAILDAPCSVVAVNFVPQDFTALNGPLRHIPADSKGNPTQTSREKIPNLSKEPDSMKLSTLLPCAAGSAIIRDLRAWHGGTPNVSEALRAIPNVEYYSESLRPGKWIKSMPKDVFDTLEPEAQRLCAHIVAPRESLDLGWRRLSGSSGGGWLCNNNSFTRTIQHRASSTIEAVRVMAQFAPNRFAGKQRIGYGVVDLELISQRGSTRFTNNGDATDTAELRVPAGETITGVVVYERYWYGIVDLQLIFASGARSGRAFPSRALSSYSFGGREQERSQQLVSGFAIREQGGYGVIDLKLL